MQGKHWYIVVVVIILGSLWLISVPPGGFWDWTGLNGKTAWDLAELLIVPLALAIVVFVFNRRQKQFEFGVAEEQRKADREIAERERENEQQIAKDREEETILQNYFDRMTTLLLEHKLRANIEQHQAEDSPIDETFTLAQARTAATLPRLSNVQRRNALLRFLQDAKLPLLRGIDLQGVDLREAKMSGMDLAEANLAGTDLKDANLQKANLRKVNLWKANLEQADLWGANLKWVDLSNANLKDAKLAGTNLQGATLIFADLEGANLSEADLRGAHLEFKLNWVNLEGADLRGVNLEGADLNMARYNDNTQWPDHFDPTDHNMLKAPVATVIRYPSDGDVLNRLLDESPS